MTAQDSEKTIVDFSKPNNSGGAELTQVGFDRPMPGGRGPGGQSPKKQSANSASQPDATLGFHNAVASVQPPVIQPLHQKIYENHANPLLAAAQPLLNEVADLHQAVQEQPIEQYRQRLVVEIQQFEMACGQIEIDEETLIYARYVLCTVLDEMVNKTPWQGKGEWNRHSLLAQYHGETGGGEKFFALLDHLLTHPAKHIQVLELMFVCLNLGFEGKYHLEQRGHLQLEKVKDNLYQVIRMQRGEPEQQLSPNWQGITDTRNPLMRYVPAWVIAAVSALILVGMFSGFSYLIEQAGNETVATINSLPVELPGVTEITKGKQQ